MRDTLKRGVRKTVKWGGAGLTVLLVGAWIGSGWWSVTVYVPGRCFAGSKPGQFLILNPGVMKGTSSHLWFQSCNSPWQWGFAYTWNRSPEIIIPIWFPALLSLLATAAAWRADAKYLRRAREGACPACGYDRAGLAAGAACPECGKQPEAR